VSLEPGVTMSGQGGAIGPKQVRAYRGNDLPGGADGRVARSGVLG
jgi:hypothetical protein